MSFKQLCVWPATILKQDQEKDFIQFMLIEFKARIKLAEVVLTLPDMDKEGCAVEGTGGRPDIFFYVHDEDISKFSIPRLSVGIRWWEDVLGNGGGKLYPQNILEKYPKGW